MGSRLCGMDITVPDFIQEKISICLNTFTFNDNTMSFYLDFEDPVDAWYGNGQLDTEDVNGNGTLDEGEDINNNGVLDTEDVDRNGALTSFNMFDRLPLWQRESSLWNLGFTHSLSENTYYTIRVAQYTTGLESNIIERLKELKELYEDGILTKEQFDKAKNILLYKNY